MQYLKMPQRIITIHLMQVLTPTTTRKALK